MSGRGTIRRTEISGAPAPHPRQPGRNKPFRRVAAAIVGAVIAVSLPLAPAGANGGLTADEQAAFASHEKRKRAVTPRGLSGVPKPEFAILGNPQLQIRPPGRPAASPPTPAAYVPPALHDPRVRQPSLPAGAATTTVAHARRIDDLIRRAGIDPARVLGHAGTVQGQGQGGPYVPLNRSQVALLRGGQATVVGGLASRPDRLLALVRKLPLIAPVKDIATSSTFGARRDPFTDGWAFHGGVDMVGPVNAPVSGTAPGVVAYAGWHDSYGRLVEIEHEFGISTRYAHLNQISVRQGQRVQAGQRVGGIGSTGRSTGPHLHYEVLVDGRQVDPQPFLDTGRDIHGN
ncbi:MAG: M23 family metallopeptidase [Rhodospirillales bacterium]